LAQQFLNIYIEIEDEPREKIVAFLEIVEDYLPNFFEKLKRWGAEYREKTEEGVTPVPIRIDKRKESELL